MFLGSIPAAMRSVTAEHVATWGDIPVGVACSGNFTIERMLAAAHPGRPLHGCDVSLYTSIIGGWLAGTPAEYELSDDARDLLPWLHLPDGPEEARVATMMQLTRIATATFKQDHLYHRRNIEGHRDQWDGLIAETARKLTDCASTVRLASYTPADAYEWVSRLDPGIGVVSYPPFDIGGYETMWAALARLIDWKPPDYPILDTDGIWRLCDLIAERRHWMLGLLERHPNLEDHLVGRHEARGARPFWIYASGGPKRRVTVHMAATPCRWPRLERGGVIDGPLSIAPMKVDEFVGLRSLHLDPRIAPGTPTHAYAVTTAGKVLGAYAWHTAKTFPIDARQAGPAAYLLADFPVAPTDYPRLSKLVVLAATSNESRLLLERATNRRYRSIVTHAFSDRPVSMKYRGVLNLLERTDLDDTDRHRHKLMYGTEWPDRTLADSLDLWSNRWGRQAA